MLSSKRDQARTERLLVATLTEACETAKAEIVGFCWLTHEVDYALFPTSLRVIWVFDTQVHQRQALAAGQDARMVELTAAALAQAGVVLDAVAAHVQFDSEQARQRENAGNGSQRLARKRPGRG
ncbi:hypothetical protein [Pseudomonas gingeri]|uniref:hypothetical protein n=1 Tax=Pseudomonas gingeri TaxID=117681 RepID=UPI0015A04458|nr:hypothetical protein [Pseudomonas gingeri]NWA01743.1 hypothetical protein [Pseudomonas gingeri]NWA12842.1 hypothetical protein [Pseudomonas gingeri]NWA57584.1 hypothetical protein [Pseudomonas gingeri]NWA93213.1 hypothetical protein [Pseudomonas gingeri]NWB03427.1 hypothetical protein [Pseudomonas gingeri]